MTCPERAAKRVSSTVDGERWLTLGHSETCSASSSWHDFFKAKGAAIRLIKTAFDDEGIDMPMPTYRVISAQDEAQEEVAPESESRMEGDTSARAKRRSRFSVR